MRSANPHSCQSVASSSRDNFVVSFSYGSSGFTQQAASRPEPHLTCCKLRRPADSCQSWLWVKAALHSPVHKAVFKRLCVASGTRTLFLHHGGLLIRMIKHAWSLHSSKVKAKVGTCCLSVTASKLKHPAMVWIRSCAVSAAQQQNH